MKFRIKTHWKEQMEYHAKKLKSNGIECRKQYDEWYVYLNSIEDVVRIIHILNRPLSIDDGINNGGKNIFIL